MSVRSLVAAISLSVLAGCGSSPTPPPPPPAAPSILCPVSQSVDAPQNVPVPVNFVVPSGSGGQAPVTVTCSAQPGSNFPLGSTLVTCTAQDALQRQASCNFNVTVVPTPVIAKTSFMAFGDSLTEGFKSDPLVAVLSRPSMGLFSLGPTHSYPFKLNDRLAARYRGQTITVVNEGWPGETASFAWAPLDGRPIGEIRFPGELREHSPQVLLLMEGTNDLYFGQGDAVRDAVRALERMVDEAQSRGTEVFIATIPPQRSGRRPDRTAVVPHIPTLNDEIRALAARKNATLVDIFAALNENLALYIGDDDLHPTDAGFTLMADTFFAAIRAKLDITPASVFGQR